MWSSVSRPVFFFALAAIAAIAAVLLLLLDPASRRVETQWRDRTREDNPALQ
jgi:hypothetical protein